MEVTRLAFNEYARVQVGDLDTRAHRVQRLSEHFGREMRRASTTLYLGAYDGDLLIGCARLVTETLGVVLLDALQVDCHHPQRDEAERALLEAARAAARERGKRLSVIVYPQASTRWTALGFHPDAQALLTIS